MMQNGINSGAIMERLDESKIRWIIREKSREDLANCQMVYP